MKNAFIKLATFGWLGTFTGIIGGVFIAINSVHYSKFGFIFFLISALSWLVQGYKNNDYPLVLLNTIFVVIDLLGIYNWFFAQSPVF